MNLGLFSFHPLTAPPHSILCTQQDGFVYVRLTCEFVFGCACGFSLCEFCSEHASIFYPVARIPACTLQFECAAQEAEAPAAES